MRFATKPIRVGQEIEKEHRAVIQPLYQSATFGWTSLSEIPAIDYTRCQNPNRQTLESIIASLENGRHCTVFASGMAAIMAALSFLESGDHILIASDIYGGTHRVGQKILPKWGVEVAEVDTHDVTGIEAKIQPNTKMIVFEGPTNPNLRIMDIEAIAEIAKRNGILSVFDNTFASPYLQNPLDAGIDMVAHSTTKYISGHSDVIGGALVTNSSEIHEAVFEYAKTVGAVPSPFDCWLTVRGLKTLSVRMKQHCENAQAIAEYLEAHPKVDKVHYPGLPSHPDHALAKRQMRGFGGMVSFEVKGTGEDACTFAESCDIFLLAESLGGVESLIGYPPLMSHATMTEEQRLAKGIPPTLIRLSVGIEDVEDLIEDLAKALDRVPAREPAIV
jgi:cystathionine beta-lyase/cystathionine gamma-synthase